MFYQAVEEYVLHSRQRRLAKGLGLQRQLQGSSRRTTVTGLQILVEAVDQLRSLVCRSESGAGSLLGCVTH